MATWLKIIRWFFLPLSGVHLVVVKIRNWLYDHNFLPIAELPVPVISVGNIQVGGSGKTPMIIFLLNWLQQNGYTVGVLSRGYRRRNKEPVIVTAQDTSKIHPEIIGDEPALILQHLEKGAIGIGARRHQVGRKLLESQRVDIILLDDGFQHRQLKRDVDICLIDVSRWSRWGLLFPFSYLRDDRRSLKRADMIVLTKFELANQSISYFREKIQYLSKAPIFQARYQMWGIRSLQDQSFYQNKGKKPAIFAFCGIANPQHFHWLLNQEGFPVVGFRSFPDHHWYTVDEVEELLQQARQKGAELLVTTEKDAVKIKALKFVSKQQEEILKHLFYAAIYLRIEPEKEFFQFLQNRLLKNVKRVGTEYQVLPNNSSEKNNKV